MSNFARTDAGNAEMFAEASSNDLRYDHQRGRWLAWRKHWWSEDGDRFVRRRAKSIARMRGQARGTQRPTPLAHSIIRDRGQTQGQGGRQWNHWQLMFERLQGCYH
jgi:hypothetical protein